MTAPFPFVVGSGRSGTTLVRTMLDSHPELAIPGESHFIPKLSHLAGFLDVVFSDQFVRNWGLSEATVRARFAEAPPATYPDAVRLLYACYADAQGKPRYGDKTPPYVRQLPLLASLFPEGRFVHVIRDGRDVALSLLGAEWFPGTLEQAAEYWRTAVEDGCLAGGALGDRYLELRYEALVADPEPQLRRVCEFIGLEYSPAMLDYGSSAQRAIDMAVHPGDHGALRLAPTTGLRDWRRDMDAADSGVVWLLAGELLAELGYPPDDRGIPAEARARALRHHALVVARRYRRAALRRLRR